MNMISKFDVDRFALKTEPHPRPFKVSWVNKTFYLLRNSV